jgi:REP element-mobilizing transposase RayT
VHSSQHAVRDADTFVSNGEMKHFSWPALWPPREPLLTLCAFTLLDNHVHLIGLEKHERGISRFMHKTGVAQAKHINRKYGETGGLFETPFQARLIASDRYVRWVVPYVLVKNTFEMHPEGLLWCTTHFDEAWQWASRYPFSSLGDYVTNRNSPLVDTDPLKRIIGGPREFKELCRDMIMGRKEKVDEDMSTLEEVSFEHAIPN